MQTIWLTGAEWLAEPRIGLGRWWLERPGPWCTPTTSGPSPDGSPIAAVVDLPEGPRMMTEVVGCAHDALHVGMDLRVCFRPAADGTWIAIPVFRPVRRPPFPA